MSKKKYCRCSARTAILAGNMKEIQAWASESRTQPLTCNTCKKEIDPTTWWLDALG